ncbi:MAG: tRNA preQ1(34) S-adenosylmethionine ribosyltransferase-isomerase QueA [Helicobacter sp.]|nr:tRNA preQ1(34) S-adenosylmethionine ribosyltransferase-isomerase QueA [Helicobacter sp.]
MQANAQDLLLDSYDYLLPAHLIAESPSKPRSSAKLLVYERQSQSIRHCYFKDFCSLVPSDYVLVCNDTKVLKARLFGFKDSANTQKRMEIFFHKPQQGTQFLVQIKGKIKRHDRIILQNDASIRVNVLELLDNGLRVVEFERNALPLNYDEVLEILQSHGTIPLPPYIKRQSTYQDNIDYQSVFACNLGAVAAPTASLHFSTRDFQRLKERYKICFVTLHIGAGTFQSVQSRDIREHVMHAERFHISSSSQAILSHALDTTKVLCVGTTCARVVESYARYHKTYGECDLFLHPHNPPISHFALLTNFHLPKSTLLMLVSALLGRKTALDLYQEAIRHEYRFYSFGDGMLIL